jgi:hypothetical protein
MTGSSEGAPQGQPMSVPPGTVMRPHQGAVILTLGILGLVYCFPLAIAAWVMGSNDLREMSAGRMDPSGRDMTNVGRVLGIISCCWVALSLLVGLGILAFWAYFAAHVVHTVR